MLSQKGIFNPILWSIALLAFGLMTGLLGCGEPEQGGDVREPFWSDIDLSNFQALSALEELSLEKVSPEENLTYWELRTIYSNDVIGGVGSKCSDAEDAEECNLEFDALRSSTSRIAPFSLLSSLQ